MTNFRRSSRFYKSRFYGYSNRYEFVIPNGIDNLTVYLFLKTNFGPPTISDKNTGLETKLQWLYHIKTPNGYLEIYDKYRTDLICFAYSLNLNGKKIQINQNENSLPASLKGDINEFIEKLQVFAKEKKLDIFSLVEDMF